MRKNLAQAHVTSGLLKIEVQRSRPCQFPFEHQNDAQLCREKKMEYCSFQWCLSQLRPTRRKCSRLELSRQDRAYAIALYWYGWVLEPLRERRLPSTFSILSDSWDRAYSETREKNVNLHFLVVDKSLWSSGWRSISQSWGGVQVVSEENWNLFAKIFLSKIVQTRILDNYRQCRWLCKPDKSIECRLVTSSSDDSWWATWTLVKTECRRENGRPWLSLDQRQGLQYEFLLLPPK